MMTTVVYSPRVWLLWVDDIGGVLTSSVAIVGATLGWLVATIHKECPSLNDIREFRCFKCTRSEQVHYFKLSEFNALWIINIYIYIYIRSTHVSCC